MTAPDQPACRGCRHFDDAAAAIESALPGLAALSSAYGSVRSSDGLCVLHDRYVANSSRCDLHTGEDYAQAELNVNRQMTQC
jgi:hypothetical protein